MEAEIARLKAESAAKDETLNQLKVKAKAFAEALTNEKKQLETQLTQSKNELNELKTKAKTFADNVKAQILVEKERVHTLEKQLQDKDAELATMRTTQPSGAIGNSQENAAALEAVRKELVQLKAEHAKEKQADMARLTELQQAQANGSTTWQSEKTQLEQRVQQLSQSLQQLQDEKTQVENQYQNKLSGLQQAMDNVSRQTQQQEGQVHEREAQIVSALQALARSTASDAFQLIASAQDEFQKYQQKVSELERQVSALETDKTQARTNSASLADSLRSQIGTLEGERDQLQWKLSEIQASQASLDSECTSLRAQLTQAQETHQNSYETLQAECAKLRQDLCQANESREAESAKLREELNEASQAHSRAIQELEMELAHAKSNHQSQTSGLEAKALALEQAQVEWAAKQEAWSKEKVELTAKYDKYVREEEEKKAKVKAYVQALTAEKQKAIEDGEKQLKERDALHEKRLAEIKAKTMAKFAEHENVIKKGQEDLEALRQQMTTAAQKYEAEIKVLQTKKKEAEDETMEVLKKKRLAAKAETQKLANDLEGIQKRAAMLVDVTQNKCSHQSKQLEVLQERVLEAIHVVSHHKKCDLSNLNELAQVVTSPRMSTSNLPGPALGLSKIDEEVSHVFDQMTALTNVTERLVDLTLEDGDLSLKEIVMDRMKKQFSACFVHNYTRADEAGLLHQKSSSTMPESPS